MNRWLFGLVAGLVAVSASAQGVTSAPASVAPSSAQTATTLPGETIESAASRKADAARKSTAKHKKKAKKSATHTAGVKVKSGHEVDVRSKHPLKR